MRLAYYMEDVDLQVRCVAKEAILAYSEANDLQYYYNDVESHLISKYIADQFMMAGSTFLPKNVDFILMSIIEFPVSERRPQDRNIFAYEPFLEGSYQKFTNNAKWRQKSEFRTMETFSHFSYHFSRGSLMVVDLQGIEHYVLTDPQIHSSSTDADLQESLFGEGNRKEAGMSNFFEDHKCNTLCDAFRVETHKDQKEKARGVSRLRPLDPSRTELLPGQKLDRKDVLGICACGQLIRPMSVAQCTARCLGQPTYCSSCTTKLAQAPEDAKCTKADGSCGGAAFKLKRHERLLGNIPLDACEGCLGPTKSKPAPFDMQYLKKFSATR